MTKTAEHITAVISFLNKNADYALLRNYEGLPNKNKSRDIDIIIPRKNFKVIKKRLIDNIINSGWKIINYLNSDRLITYVCAYIDKEDIELVQWDFFMDTSVFGILLMDAPEFLKYKRYNGFLYHVDVNGAFLDKYLYNRAVGAQYPNKYLSTRKSAEQSEIVKSKIKKLYGMESLEECDKCCGKKLIVHAILFNIKNSLIKTLLSFFRFLYYFIRNYICSNTGFSIGFTGPDGSGKTTVIDLLIDKLGGVFNKAHTYFHFRPMLFGNIGDVAQSAGLKKDVDREYDKPHRGNKTNILSSLLRLLYYSTDYVLGYFIKIKSITRITRLAIFDRYYTDIICDSKRTRIYLNTNFLYWFGRLFIPALDYNIFLTASTNTILSRKKELDKKGIEDINAKIDYLSTKKGYKKIMNDSTPEIAVSEILKYIFDCQHKKNLKRM